MMNIYIPTHMDSGNRGCEGIYRGTEIILNEYNIQAYSGDKALDIRLGLNPNNIKEKNDFTKIKKYGFKIKRLMKTSNRAKKYLSIQENAECFLKDFSDESENIVLSTGGDEFCYDDNWVVYLGEYLNCINAKLVLWGCSIGKENLSEDKIAALKRFDIIVARESLTEELLKKELGLKNVYCFPDPAFAIKPEVVEIDELDVCKKDIVGINLSNFVSANVGENSIFRRNIYKLIEYILAETEMNILLIPHVFWKQQDDRIICNEIYEKYCDTSRINVLDSEKFNYCQIRYVIGKCRFFVGARTHAVVSAYSMCIPTVALGYSVKSIGIARDLGLPENLVVDYRNIQKDEEVKRAFIYMMNNETEIKNHLEAIIPEYSNKSVYAKQIFQETL